MANPNPSLLAMSNAQAEDVSGIVDRGAQSLVVTYRRLAKAPRGERYAKLKAAIVGTVDGGRAAANELAATHLLDQLRKVIGSKVDNVSLGLNARPKRAEVDQYIDNAVDAARAADENDAGIESTEWHALRVLESEVFREYDEARRVAESSLAALSDDAAARLGFQVARKQSQLRDIGNIETRGDVPLVPVFGKMWNAVGDKRTCQVCSALDGSLGLLGSEYDPSNPPAHSRCRCVTTLWAVGWIDTEKAMTDTVERDSPAEPIVRAYAAIDTRATNEETRTILGAVASTEAIDSHGSIIRAKGWNLSRYESNPILVWNHALSNMFTKAMPEDILGTASMRVDKRGKRLLADLHFAPEGANPRADMVWGQVQRGEVRGLSVGFQPTKYHFEAIDGDTEDERMVIDNADLVELSVVALPSNAETLIAQVRSLFGQPDDKACCAHEVRKASASADNKNKEQATMTTEVVTALPAEIVAILGTSDAVEAVKQITQDKLRVSQLEDALARKDEAIATANAATEVVKAELVEARSALTAQHDKACDAEVDSLVALGLVKETQRDMACKFARSDLDGFKAFYAEEREEMAKRTAPMAALLDTTPVVKVKASDGKVAPTRPIADHAAIHRAKAIEIQNRDKCDWSEACARAFNELQASA